jgi:carbonic anhydrase
MQEALAALERLREGNRRYVADRDNHLQWTTETRRRELVAGQHPFAIILGCSDSRAPAEIVFDQGLGSLFVIRVAGNIVAPSLIGSAEFAAEHLGTRLLVVLGHSHCGAVAATLADLERPSLNQSPNLCSIVDRIRPAVVGLWETELRHNSEGLLAAAVRANVRASVQQLRSSSAVLERLIQEEKLLVVGAEYSLETGEVDFFEGV